MKFSQVEKIQLMHAGLLISLAFAILLSGGYNLIFNLFSLEVSFLAVFIIAFFTAGIAFLFHEIMHKYVAQSYGLKAEFRAYYPGLLMALVFSLFGFIIAAPGAVVIQNFHLTREQNGKISLAGPMTNILLAIIFLSLILTINVSGLLESFFQYGLMINSLLAVFNLLPLPPFDGRKVLSWNKGIYIITIILAVGLFAATWLI